MNIKSNGELNPENLEKVDNRSQSFNTTIVANDHGNQQKVVKRVGRPRKGQKKIDSRLSVSDIQVAIVQEFDVFNKDRELIVNHIIELGKTLPEMPAVNKTDNALVYGCLSQVWVSYIKSKTTVKYVCYSDSDFIKGLLFLMMKVLNDQPYDEIIDAELYFINQIGLLSILGRQRSLGLANIIKQFKMIAVIEKNRPRHGRKPKKV